MTLIEAVAGHADRQPDHPAVKDGSAALTYRELWREVEAVAAGYIAAGVEPGDRVALHIPNSVDYVIAALAALRVRAIFVPVSPNDPEARLAVILGDCYPRLVVTGHDDPEAGLAYAGLPAGVDRYPAAVADLRRPGGDVPDEYPRPEDGAYMIYTSGTTGTPKGVFIGHAAFRAALDASVSVLGLSPATKSLCVSPFHFDGSFGILFSTLFAGGSLVTPPRDALLFPRTFFNAVAREGITFTSFSPSYLRLLRGDRRMGTLAETDLQMITLGGEATTLPDLEALWAAAPDVRVINRYGPTETTIAVSHCELTPARVGRGPVPIGQPNPNVTFYIVDEQGGLVSEPGVTGELYVGGAQLMTGYWAAPEATAAVLRTDIVPGETLYETGDLVYRDASGDYVYVDRADRVIKRSGVRISLIELGGVLGAVPGVAAATCVAYDEDGQVGIAAFVAGERDLNALEVKRQAAIHLPDTMLPDRFAVLDALPMTSASKVDERALLAAAGLKPPPRP